MSSRTDPVKGPVACEAAYIGIDHAPNSRSSARAALRVDRPPKFAPLTSRGAPKEVEIGSLTEDVKTLVGRSAMRLRASCSTD